MLTNQIVDFFRARISELDPLCCNFSFVNGDKEEIIYNLPDKNYPKAHHDIFEMVFREYFPDIDPERVDAISYQQADGALYTEDKVMVSIDGAKKDCFLHPEIGCFDPWQHYCINSGVNTKKRSYKFYSLDTDAYTCMQFPDFIKLFDKYGAGVGIKPDVVGIYFLSKQHDQVVKYFGLPEPIPADIRQRVIDTVDIHNYGLTFNIRTKEFIKLSYFLYNEPNRPDIIPYIELFK